ncbi:7 transmembrane receptor (rhodopsin family) [Popillia japonica]|uniref:7 transmembrane receptor (Rhodopsin family) n=1 Tax=Popillia japonica TaxID=7064 RepID=A0AAW1LBV3_POPJA
MSAFPYTRRNGATTYVDAPSNSINSNGSSYFRAVIADSSTPTANIELLSTIFPESMNITGVSVVGSSTIGPNGDEINSFYFYKTEQFTLLWVLFTMIVLGNSAVLVTLLIGKTRKSRMNFFIRHLAIADLAVGLINVSTDIVWRITVAWHAGNVLCKLIRFMQAVVTYSSTYVLVALSIDRYDAITHPMNFSGSWKRARVLVVIAWMLSFLFSSPTIFLFEEKPVEGLSQCWIDLENWQWQVYMTLVSLALFVIPALIIGGCYAVIVWTIWSKSKLIITTGHMPMRRQSDDQKDRPPRYANEENDCRRASSRGIIPRAKIKTVKMTFVIVFDIKNKKGDIITDDDQIGYRWKEHFMELFGADTNSDTKVESTNQEMEHEEEELEQEKEIMKEEIITNQEMEHEEEELEQEKEIMKEENKSMSFNTWVWYWIHKEINSRKLKRE